LSAHQDISIRIEIHGTCQNQKIGSALASLGVFASPWVANPRKGRLRDAEAAEISPERSEPRSGRYEGYEGGVEAAVAE